MSLWDKLPYDIQYLILTARHKLMLKDVLEEILKVKHLEYFHDLMEMSQSEDGWVQCTFRNYYQERRSRNAMALSFPVQDSNFWIKRALQ